MTYTCCNCTVIMGFFCSFLFLIWSMLKEFEPWDVGRWVGYGIMYIIVWAYSAFLVHAGTSCWNTGISNIMQAMFYVLSTLGGFIILMVVGYIIWMKVEELK